MPYSLAGGGGNPPDGPQWFDSLQEYTDYLTRQGLTNASKAATDMLESLGEDVNVKGIAASFNAKGQLTSATINAEHAVNGERKTAFLNQSFGMVTDEDKNKHWDYRSTSISTDSDMAGEQAIAAKREQLSLKNFKATEDLIRQEARNGGYITWSQDQKDMYQSAMDYAYKADQAIDAGRFNAASTEMSNFNTQLARLKTSLSDSEKTTKAAADTQKDFDKQVEKANKDVDQAVADKNYQRLPESMRSDMEASAATLATEKTPENLETLKGSVGEVQNALKTLGEMDYVDKQRQQMEQYQAQMEQFAGRNGGVNQWTQAQQDAYAQIQNMQQQMSDALSGGDKGTTEQMSEAIRSAQSNLNQSLTQSKQLISDYNKTVNNELFKGVGDTLKQELQDAYQGMMSDGSTESVNAFADALGRVKTSMSDIQQNDVFRQQEEQLNTLTSKLNTMAGKNGGYSNWTESQQAQFQNMQMSWAALTQMHGGNVGVGMTLPGGGVMTQEMMDNLPNFGTFSRGLNVANQQSQQLNNNFRLIGTNAGAMDTQVDALSRHLANMAAPMMMWRRFSGYIKQAAQNVAAVDTQMADLRKVTNNTGAEYDRFLASTGQNAVAIGAKISDLVATTSTFAHMGYSLTDSQALGVTATKFANVGNFQNTTDAADAMIAVVKGFDDLSIKDADLVGDKLTAVANNYAVTANDIAEGLQKSASSLNVAGNNVDQSAAMITAIAEVTRDAGAAGSALKVLSMRIRGAKTEIEESGESTDGMAESTSKLRKQVKALTNVHGTGGVDIMQDEDTFKSTYDIMSEISDVWKDMSDVDQSALLELLAGKVRSNQVASLLSNFDQAEKALQTSQNAEGTMDKVHQAWMDSVDARKAQFEAAGEALSMTAMPADTLKGLYQAGTTGLGLLNSLMGFSGSGGVSAGVLGLATTLRSGNGSIAAGLGNIFGLHRDNVNGGLTHGNAGWVNAYNQAFRDTQNRTEAYNIANDAMLQNGEQLDGYTQKLYDNTDGLIDASKVTSSFGSSIKSFAKNALVGVGTFAAIELAAAGLQALWGWFDSEVLHKGETLANNAAMSFAEYETAQQKANEAATEKEEIQSQIDTLRGKANTGELTTGEQAQLTDLESQMRTLEFTQKLLDMQAKQAAKEAYDDFQKTAEHERTHQVDAGGLFTANAQQDVMSLFEQAINAANTAYHAAEWGSFESSAAEFDRDLLAEASTNMEVFDSPSQFLATQAGQEAVAAAARQGVVLTADIVRGLEDRFESRATELAKEYGEQGPNVAAVRGYAEAFTELGKGMQENKLAPEAMAEAYTVAQKMFGQTQNAYNALTDAEKEQLQDVGAVQGLADNMTNIGSMVATAYTALHDRAAMGLASYIGSGFTGDTAELQSSLSGLMTLQGVLNPGRKYDAVKELFKGTKMEDAITALDKLAASSEVTADNISGLTVDGIENAGDKLANILGMFGISIADFADMVNVAKQTTDEGVTTTAARNAYEDRRTAVQGVITARQTGAEVWSSSGYTGAMTEEDYKKIQDLGEASYLAAVEYAQGGLFFNKDKFDKAVQQKYREELKELQGDVARETKKFNEAAKDLADKYQNRGNDAKAFQESLDSLMGIGGNLSGYRRMAGQMTYEMGDYANWLNNKGGPESDAMFNEVASAAKLIKDTQKTGRYGTREYGAAIQLFTGQEGFTHDQFNAKDWTTLNLFASALGEDENAAVKALAEFRDNLREAGILNEDYSMAQTMTFEEIAAQYKEYHGTNIGSGDLMKALFQGFNAYIEKEGEKYQTGESDAYPLPPEVADAQQALAKAVEDYKKNQTDENWKAVESAANAYLEASEKANFEQLFDAGKTDEAAKAIAGQDAEGKALSDTATAANDLTASFAALRDTVNGLNEEYGGNPPEKPGAEAGAGEEGAGAESTEGGQENKPKFTFSAKKSAQQPAAEETAPEGEPGGSASESADSEDTDRDQIIADQMAAAEDLRSQINDFVATYGVISEELEQAADELDSVAKGEGSPEDMGNILAGAEETLEGAMAGAEEAIGNAQEQHDALQDQADTISDLGGEVPVGANSLLAQLQDVLESGVVPSQELIDRSAAMFQMLAKQSAIMQAKQYLNTIDQMLQEEPDNQDLQNLKKQLQGMLDNDEFGTENADEILAGVGEAITQTANGKPARDQLKQRDALMSAAKQYLEEHPEAEGVKSAMAALAGTADDEAGTDNYGELLNSLEAELDKAAEEIAADAVQALEEGSDTVSNEELTGNPDLYKAAANLKQALSGASLPELQDFVDEYGQQMEEATKTKPALENLSQQIHDYLAEHPGYDSADLEAKRDALWDMFNGGEGGTDNFWEAFAGVEELLQNAPGQEAGALLGQAQSLFGEYQDEGLGQAIGVMEELLQGGTAYDDNFWEVFAGLEEAMNAAREKRATEEREETARRARVDDLGNRLGNLNKMVDEFSQDEKGGGSNPDFTEAENAMLDQLFDLTQTDGITDPEALAQNLLAAQQLFEDLKKSVANTQKDRSDKLASLSSEENKKIFDAAGDDSKGIIQSAREAAEAAYQAGDWNAFEEAIGRFYEETANAFRDQEQAENQRNEAIKAAQEEAQQILEDDAVVSNAREALAAGDSTLFDLYNQLDEANEAGEDAEKISQLAGQVAEANKGYENQQVEIRRAQAEQEKQGAINAALQKDQAELEGLQGGMRELNAGIAEYAEGNKGLITPAMQKTLEQMLADTTPKEGQSAEEMRAAMDAARKMFAGFQGETERVYQEAQAAQAQLLDQYRGETFKGANEEERDELTKTYQAAMEAFESGNMADAINLIGEFNRMLGASATRQQADAEKAAAVEAERQAVAGAAQEKLDAVADFLETVGDSVDVGELRKAGAELDRLLSPDTPAATAEEITTQTAAMMAALDNAQAAYGEYQEKQRKAAEFDKAKNKLSGDNMPLAAQVLADLAENLDDVKGAADAADALDAAAKTGNAGAIDAAMQNFVAQLNASLAGIAKRRGDLADLQQTAEGAFLGAEDFVGGHMGNLKLYDAWNALGEAIVSGTADFETLDGLLQAFNKEMQLTKDREAADLEREEREAREQEDSANLAALQERERQQAEADATQRAADAYDRYQKMADSGKMSEAQMKAANAAISKAADAQGKEGFVEAVDELESTLDGIQTEINAKALMDLADQERDEREARAQEDSDNLGAMRDRIAADIEAKRDAEREEAREEYINTSGWADENQGGLTEEEKAALHQAKLADLAAQKLAAQQGKYDDKYFTTSEWDGKKSATGTEPNAVAQGLTEDTQVAADEQQEAAQAMAAAAEAAQDAANLNAQVGTSAMTMQERSALLQQLEDDRQRNNAADEKAYLDAQELGQYNADTLAEQAQDLADQIQEYADATGDSDVLGLQKELTNAAYSASTTDEELSGMIDQAQAALNEKTGAQDAATTSQRADQQRLAALEQERAAQEAQDQKDLNDAIMAERELVAAQTEQLSAVQEPAPSAISASVKDIGKSSFLDREDAQAAMDALYDEAYQYKSEEHKLSQDNRDRLDDILDRSAGEYETLDDLTSAYDQLRYALQEIMNAPPVEEEPGEGLEQTAAHGVNAAERPDVMTSASVEPELVNVEAEDANVELTGNTTVASGGSSDAGAANLGALRKQAQSQLMQLEDLSDNGTFAAGSPEQLAVDKAIQQLNDALNGGGADALQEAMDAADKATGGKRPSSRVGTRGGLTTPPNLVGTLASAGASDVSAMGGASSGSDWDRPYPQHGRKTNITGQAKDATIGKKHYGAPVWMDPAMAREYNYFNALKWLDTGDPEKAALASEWLKNTIGVDEAKVQELSSRQLEYLWDLNVQQSYQDYWDYSLAHPLEEEPEDAWDYHSWTNNGLAIGTTSQGMSIAEISDYLTGLIDAGAQTAEDLLNADKPENGGLGIVSGAWSEDLASSLVDGVNAAAQNMQEPSYDDWEFNGIGIGTTSIGANGQEYSIDELSDYLNDLFENGAQTIEDLFEMDNPANGGLGVITDAYNIDMTADNVSVRTGEETPFGQTSQPMYQDLKKAAGDLLDASKSLVKQDENGNIDTTDQLSSAWMGLNNAVQGGAGQDVLQGLMQSLQSLYDSAMQQEGITIPTEIEQPESIEVPEPNPVTVPVNADTSSAQGAISSLGGSVTVSVDADTSSAEETIKGLGGGGSDTIKISKAAAEGTENAVSAPYLVDEAGAELIEHRSRGTYELGTDMGARFTKLDAGDIVHNAKDTKKILRRGFAMRNGGVVTGQARPGGTPSGTVVEGKDGPGTGKFSYDTSSKDRAIADAQRAAANAEAESKAAFDLVDHMAIAMLKWIKKILDWIPTYLNVLKKKTTEFVGAAEDAVHYLSQNQLLDSAIGNIAVEIQANVAAVARYRSFLRDLATKSGFSDDMVALIQKGAIDITEFSDENTVKSIQTYQQYWEKLVACQDALATLNDQMEALSKQKLDNIVSYFDRIDGLLQDQQKRFESLIDLKKQYGQELKSEDYTGSLSTMEQKLTNALEEQAALISELEQQLGVGGDVVQAILDGGKAAWDAIAVHVKKGVDEGIADLQEAIDDNIYVQTGTYAVGRMQVPEVSTATTADELAATPVESKFLFSQGSAYNGYLNLSNIPDTHRAAAVQQAAAAAINNLQYDNPLTQQMQDSIAENMEMRAGHLPDVEISKVEIPVEPASDEDIAAIADMLGLNISDGTEEALRNLETIKSLFTTTWDNPLAIGSETWYSYMSTLESLQESINSTKIEISEMNDEIANIPLTNLKTGYDYLEEIRKNLEGVNSLLDAQGAEKYPETYRSLISVGMRQIENLEEQNKLIEEQMSALDPLSEKYQELRDDLRGNLDTIADIRENQEEWNDAIIDLQIDRLKKQNDSYKEQLRLMQALDDLEKAKQRRILIYHDEGGFRYEADEDALEAAQEAANDAVFSSLVSSLEESKETSNIYGPLGERLIQGSSIIDSLGNTLVPVEDKLSGLNFEPYYQSILNGAEQSGLLASMLSTIDMAKVLEQAIGGDVNIDISGMTLNGVNDAEELGDAIINQLPNYLLQALYKKGA